MDLATRLDIALRFLALLQEAYEKGASLEELAKLEAEMVAAMTETEAPQGWSVADTSVES